MINWMIAKNLRRLFTGLVKGVKALIACLMPALCIVSNALCVIQLVDEYTRQPKSSGAVALES